MFVPCRALVALALIFLASLPAFAQSTLLQGGPWAPGRAPMYVGQGSGQAVVQDSGPAGGGGIGLGLAEQLLTVRGAGAPPYANGGSGPLGENWCDWDAPLTNATGGHVLCLSPNAQGGGLISYNAFGAASQLPLYMNINGISYQFPFALSGVVGPATTVIGDLPLWNNPTGTLLSDSGVKISGIAANVLNTQTSNYTIATTDCGKTIQAGTGSTGFFTITAPNPTSPSVFPTTCVVTILNGDTVRGKAVVGGSQTLNCSSLNLIWPGQACQIGVVNGTWQALSRPGRYKPPAATIINFNTDFTNGTDTVGATDGLATGAAAFKSAEYCQLLAADQIDFNTESQTKVICNMAAATNDTQGMHTPVHALVGAQGGAALQIIGASLAIAGAVSNGGLCEITVSATASYTANQVVSVYGVGGATGCNGSWKVTVTDSTHLTLQSTTFGGAYTSGGTVTNGSILSSSSQPSIACYFGTVMQIQNITFTSASAQGINPTQQCKLYINEGNIFGSAAAGIYITADAQVFVQGSIGISASMTNAFVQGDTGGKFLPLGAYNINFVPGVNPSFSGLGFAYAAKSGTDLVFQNLTINLNSNTVTGARCAVVLNALVDSETGAPNSYFPGNSNCTTATGGVVN